jgi:hypothetical protein
VDFAQMRDFQSGFEYLSRSKTFLHGFEESPAEIKQKVKELLLI